MSFLLVALFVIASFAAAPPKATCTANRENLFLNFEDFQILPSDFIGLPWPYKDFLFVRGGGWMDKHVPILNVTGYAYYSNAASSGSNILLTTGEALTMEQMLSTQGPNTFVVNEVSLSAIFIDQAMFIELTRNGTVVHRQIVALKAQQRQTVTLTSQVSADRMVVGCVDPSFPTCAHVAYDDFSLCYRHSQ